MRELSGVDAPPTERLLSRDPDTAKPARRSAVERLAADRAKYVRGGPGATRGPASDGDSPGAGEGQACDPRAQARAPSAVARRAITRKPLRPDSLVIYRQKCEFVRGPGAGSLRDSLVKKLLPGPGKEKTQSSSEASPTGEEGRARGEEAAPTKHSPAAAPAAPARPSVPAALSAPPARPSVLDALSPSPAPRARPSVPDALSAPPEPPVRPNVPAALSAPPARPSVPAASGSPELRAARRRGLQRSQSDLSSRYSMSAAEFDTFFQFCGLEPEVVEALGRENFSAGSDRVALKVRSVSVATSDSGFSRLSGGDEGLQEEELTEQVPSTTSVVERNARIIKWLYTCKKAKESPGPRLQGPV